MVTVDSCCCLSLETGALIIGWLGIIGNAIVGLLFIGLIFQIDTGSCNYFWTARQFQETYLLVNDKDCEFVKTIVTIFFVVGLVFSVIGFTVYILLVTGIKTQNSGKIFPAVVFCGIEVVLLILGYFLTLSLKVLVGAIIGGALSIYFWIILYSVYVKIRDE